MELYLQERGDSILLEETNGHFRPRLSLMMDFASLSGRKFVSLPI
jgi:hypothetical protein